jgi:hypothetical protein
METRGGSDSKEDEDVDEKRIVAGCRARGSALGWFGSKLRSRS